MWRWRLSARSCRGGFDRGEACFAETVERDGIGEVSFAHPARATAGLWQVEHGARKRPAKGCRPMNSRRTTMTARPKFVVVGRANNAAEGPVLQLGRRKNLDPTSYRNFLPPEITWKGAVAKLVEIKVGVVSGLLNPQRSRCLSAGMETTP